MEDEGVENEEEGSKKVRVIFCVADYKQFVKPLTPLLPSPPSDPLSLPLSLSPSLPLSLPPPFLPIKITFLSAIVYKVLFTCYCNLIK